MTLSHPLSIYLCGGSSEIDLVEHYVAAVRELGMRVTFDWTAHMRAANAADRDLSSTVRLASAQGDLSAILDASIVWYLAPVKPSFGAGVEFGWALARRAARQQIGLLASGDTAHSIFTSLSDRCFADHEEALEYLRLLTSARRPR